MADTTTYSPPAQREACERKAEQLDAEVVEAFVLVENKVPEITGATLPTEARRDFGPALIAPGC